jgi:cysteine-rich repeat protein
MKHNPLMIWLVAVVGCSSSTPLGDPDGDVCDPVAELCDGIDNDCDGVIDEGGHGGPMIRDCSTACGTGTEECRAGTWERCDAPQPADETCNGLDDDCDGLIDEDIALAFFQDRDHDGFGTYGVTITACDLPEGYVQNGDDCDDGDPTVHPGAEELMDGIDNDCNGEVDEGVPDGDVCPNLVRQCGDGVLDDGEQCDDYNRLNGDGCDWLCRLGDGEPPPLLDRAVSVYEPVGESFVMNDLIPEWPWPLPRIPLVWTGTELAIAVSQEIPEGIADVRFRRFDTEARAIGIDWVSPSVTYGHG